ncbi:hypothetical protein BDR04DRAFT_1231011 [Suillus decipiens]|nr:hypothetical protein BDR04DRAFT_1231011 [Suillus decipiens]
MLNADSAWFAHTPSCHADNLNVLSAPTLRTIAQCFRCHPMEVTKTDVALLATNGSTRFPNL